MTEQDQNDSTTSATGNGTTTESTDTADSTGTNAGTPEAGDRTAPAKKTARKRTTKKAAAPRARAVKSTTAKSSTTASSAAEPAATEPADATAAEAVAAEAVTGATDPAAEPAADAPPAAKAPAKRAPRKRATKKTAASVEPPATEPTAAAEAPAVDAEAPAEKAPTENASTEVVPVEATPTKRAPRKRAPRKTATAPLFGTGEAVADAYQQLQRTAELDVEPDEDLPVETPVTDPALEPTKPTGIAPAFVAPEVTPVRRRRVQRPAEDTAPVDASTDTTDSTEATSSADEATSSPTLTADSRPAPSPRSSDDETDATSQDSAGDASSDDDEGGSRRRRRRRGGRGRRRRSDEPETSGDSTDSGDSADGRGSDTSGREAGTGERSDSGDADTDTDGDTTTDNDAQDGDDSGESGSSRRRRRRRRRGDDSDAGSGGGDAERSATRSVVDEVTVLKGSTRLEAKKQRRREGREAGRRRPPIVSEAEFLARRESVKRVMAVRQRGDLTQIGVLEDDVLVEHYVSRASQQSLIGNVYLGRVQNVLPSMEAAFIDIGKGRNAVLYAGEVDWAALGHTDGRPKRIEEALKSGQSVLVQVSKDPIGHKGARLTSQISLPGRFVVYVPGGTMSGISRKLPDTERARLKQILKQVVPEDAGVIVRTAAEGASEEELTADVTRLRSTWEAISKKASGNGPQLLHGEPELAIKVVRDLFNEDFAKLIVAGDRAWGDIDEYVGSVAMSLKDRVERASDSDDIFARLRIDEQIAKAMERKVWLPSGGSLVIDRTEAMTVVDVNTGKFTGSGGNLEETVTRNNLEAAEEVVRQLRLRDIGGIVVIDFIDMVLEANRDLVLRRLVECLGRDRTKHQVAEVTSLGLVQMTRKRIGTGLLEAFSEPCEHCKGRGLVVHDHPVGFENGAFSGNNRGSDGSGSRGSNGGHDRGDRRGRRRRGADDDNQARSDQAQPQSQPTAPETPAIKLESHAVPGAASPADLRRIDAEEAGDTTGNTSGDTTGDTAADPALKDLEAAVEKSVAAAHNATTEPASASTPEPVAGSAAEPVAESVTRPRRTRRRAARPAGETAADTAAVVVPPVEEQAATSPAVAVEPAAETPPAAAPGPVVEPAAEPVAPPRRTRRRAARPAGETAAESAAVVVAPVADAAAAVTQAGTATAGTTTVGTAAAEVVVEPATPRRTRRRAQRPAGGPQSEGASSESASTPV